MNTQDWSPLGWTGWISSKSKGLSRVFSNIFSISRGNLSSCVLWHMYCDVHSNTPCNSRTEKNSYLFSITNLVTWTARIYYLIFSVDEESRHGLVGSYSPGLLTRLWSKCWPELWSHLKTGERLTSEFTWLSTVKFFVGWQTEGLLFAGYWLVAALISLPRDHLQYDSLLHQNQQGS